MFRHFCVIIREFYICALLSYIKFLSFNFASRCSFIHLWYYGL